MNTLQLYRSGKQFRWRFTAANGRKLANGGEAYQRRRDLLKAARVIFPRFVDGDGYFERPLHDGSIETVRVKDDTQPKKKP